MTFFADLLVEVVLGVLGFPITKRHADGVDERTVDVAALAVRG